MRQGCVAGGVAGDALRRLGTRPHSITPPPSLPHTCVHLCCPHFASSPSSLDDRGDDIPTIASSASVRGGGGLGGGGSSSASVAGGGGGADAAGTSGSAAAAEAATTALFAAAISPDYSITGGRLRRLAAAGSAGGGGGVAPHFAAAAVCLSFHPTAPLLAAADGSGRVVVWRVGLADGVHATVASRDFAMPPAPDGSPRTVTSLLLHPSLPRLVVAGYAPDAPK